MRSVSANLEGRGCGSQFDYPMLCGGKGEGAPKGTAGEGATAGDADAALRLSAQPPSPKGRAFGFTGALIRCAHPVGEGCRRFAFCSSRETVCTNAISAHRQTICTKVTVCEGATAGDADAALRLSATSSTVRETVCTNQISAHIPCRGRRPRRPVNRSAPRSRRAKGHGGRRQRTSPVAQTPLCGFLLRPRRSVKRFATTQSRRTLSHFQYTKFSPPFYGRFVTAL